MRVSSARYLLDFQRGLFPYPATLGCFVVAAKGAVFLFWRAFMLPRYVAFLLASAIGAYAVHQIVTCSGDVPRTPLFGAALALLMVNMHTVADELLILGLFVKFVGYETTAWSVQLLIVNC